jgi:hypothetical protein
MFPHYLRRIIILFLIVSINCVSIYSQYRNTSDWEKDLSVAVGQDRVDLLLKLSSELLKENLTLADSLAREGLTLAKQLGTSGLLYYTLESGDFTASKKIILIE